ncbi:serine hydrolase domain-containing protein [Phenylobacterium sp. VNQ135]|uniref:serine hydrolase domain-containing protein n=1 Tax=Phenylobacterium sp. VNQ135 TaxID=3400922 RepID=UPI003C05C7FD
MRQTTLAAALALACLATSGCSAEPGASGNLPVACEAPPTRGLDAGRMQQVVRDAAQLPRLRALIVLRHGETLAEHRFNGGPPLDRPVNVKSASKSILSALVGIAISKGVLTGADQPVLSVLQRDAPADPDPRLQALTVGQLLSMQAGLERTSGPNYGRWVSSPNWVRYALSRPFVDAPGGRMLYSTGSSHLVSAMLTRASGRSTLELARDWLGEPLGVEIPAWPRDPQGVYFGGNDMLLSPRALARFGELYRNGGRAGGRQIVPEAWIAESWRPRTVSPWSGNSYGYGWFLSEAGGHEVRFAWGYGGQMLYIVPDLGLTVVMTSDATAPREGDHIGALHRLLADGIIPAAVAGA